jgi:hypothetical protein
MFYSSLTARLFILCVHRICYSLTAPKDYVPVVMAVVPIITAIKRTCCEPGATGVKKRANTKGLRPTCNNVQFGNSLTFRRNMQVKVTLRLAVSQSVLV